MGFPPDMRVFCNFQNSAKSSKSIDSPHCPDSFFPKSRVRPGLLSQTYGCNEDSPCSPQFSGGGIIRYAEPSCFGSAVFLRENVYGFIATNLGRRILPAK